MSAGAVVTQFSNLLSHMESLGPRLSSNIRPNRDQLDEIKRLNMRLKVALADIESHVGLLLSKAAPSAKELELASRIRSSKTTDQLSPSLTTMFRKNLVLIYLGPDESALDTTKVRTRKAKTRNRCEKLRAQSPHLILMWVMTLQPSAWIHPTVMADSTFDFLIEELKADEFSQIPISIAKSLDCLKTEEPFTNCESFQVLVKSIHQSTEIEQDHTVRLKRKRSEQDTPTYSVLSKKETDLDKRQAEMIERRSKGKSEHRYVMHWKVMLK